MNRKFTRLVFLAATFPLACSAGNEPVDNGNSRPGGLECAVPGATACATACVDLQTDLNNCGNCASACGVGQTCQSGVCAGGNNAGSGGSTGSGGASNTGTGGDNVIGATGGAAETGGSAATGGTGGTVSDGVARTVELIAADSAACGAKNATHGDGFVCVLNYPAEGSNVVGYWFDYPFTAGGCKLSHKQPAGNNGPNPQVCFSASDCAPTSGGGHGVALCDVHGIDASTWPQMMALQSDNSLSSTEKSPFSSCNAGGAITSVNWTLGSGSIPAGTSVLFDNAADVNIAKVDTLATGATSVTPPAGVDLSDVATIKFSVNGAGNPNWNFCLTSLTVSSK